MMKKRLQVYISPEADVLLRKMAAANMRSISATVEFLILDAHRKPYLHTAQTKLQTGDLTQ